MPRSERLYLTDIVEAADAIRRFIGDRSREDFLRDELLQSAVLQKLTVIGEAASHLGPEFRQRQSAVPWRRVVAFRNIAVHAYFAVDWELVWVTATRHAPDLALQIAEILDREYPPSPPAGADEP